MGKDPTRSLRRAITTNHEHPGLGARNTAQSTSDIKPISEVNFPFKDSGMMRVDVCQRQLQRDFSSWLCLKECGTWEVRSIGSGILVSLVIVQYGRSWGSQQVMLEDHRIDRVWSTQALGYRERISRYITSRGMLDWFCDDKPLEPWQWL